MSAAEVIDLDAGVVQDYSEPDVNASSQAADDASKQQRSGLSSMYQDWGFEPAGKRDRTHSGAQCLPCKGHAQRKGKTTHPSGSCLADLPSILTHVKNCTPHEPANRQRATVELKILRDKKKPAVKRGFTTMAAASDTEGSSGQGSSKQPRLSRFLAHKDKKLSKSEQHDFEQLCLKATVSGNLPLQVWDDAAFNAMLLSLRPEADIPSRKTMSTRILDAGATLAEDEMKAIVKECEGVCLATDSWTSIRRRQIMAFVIITSERQALPHRSLDTTAERHFAEILCQHMLEEIEIVERDFETKVKAIITDAASDCRKARSLVVEQLPHILSLDCFAHQMNLLVSNYLKHEPMAAEAMKQAFDLINWWRWHLVPFEWLLAEMEHPLALLTGCLTRWGSQVAAIIRLLQFKEAMLVVLLRKKQAILDTIARREQRDKAEVLLSAAQKDDFWSSLAHLVQNLLPIRIALRVLESDSARLDSVLEQFGSMANHFSYSPLMMDSLEKRWAKMEQKLFLLAYVLHPARMLQHINPKLEFAYSCNIATYASELYERLFSDSTAGDSSEVFKQVACYLGKKGAFANSVPKYTNSKEDPGTFWSLMKQSAPQLARLATHLSQVAVNSAAVERLFSAFLNIQTKRRNKLVHERVHKIAAIKALLPVKPRPKKKPAGQQYLGRRPNTRGASLSGEAAQKQLTAASEKTEQQFLDGAEDMVEEAEQVQGLVDDFCQQVSDDEADDVEYVVQSSSTRCKLADLFVDMPAFDLELLFEDEVDPEAS